MGMGFDKGGKPGGLGDSDRAKDQRIKRVIPKARRPIVKQIRKFSRRQR